MSERCDFCGREQAIVRKLFRGEKGGIICDECVKEAAKCLSS